jgi:hypothetical protein
MILAEPNVDQVHVSNSNPIASSDSRTNALQRIENDLPSMQEVFEARIGTTDREGRGPCLEGQDPSFVVCKLPSDGCLRGRGRWRFSSDRRNQDDSQLLLLDQVHVRKKCSHFRLKRCDSSERFELRR